MNRSDITGERYGYLTVLRDTGKRTTGKNKSRIWECQCDCGAITYVPTNRLKSGKTKSCGCYAQKVRGDSHRKHGGTKTRLYNIWSNMRGRCNNPNDPAYSRYGGRGITMNEDWNDFSKFQDWAIRNGYDENARGHDCTIDRINNDGSYSPDNCRWVSANVQSRNKSNNRYYTINGETKVLKDWARSVNADVRTIIARLNRGWPIEKALYVPIDHRRGIRQKKGVEL